MKISRIIRIINGIKSCGPRRFPGLVPAFAGVPVNQSPKMKFSPYLLSDSVFARGGKSAEVEVVKKIKSLYAGTQSLWAGKIMKEVPVEDQPKIARAIFKAAAKDAKAEVIQAIFKAATERMKPDIAEEIIKGTSEYDRGMAILNIMELTGLEKKPDILLRITKYVSTNELERSLDRICTYMPLESRTELIQKAILRAPQDKRISLFKAAMGIIPSESGLEVILSVTALKDLSFSEWKDIAASIVEKMWGNHRAKAAGEVVEKAPLEWKPEIARMTIDMLIELYERGEPGFSYIDFAQTVKKIVMGADPNQQLELAEYAVNKAEKSETIIDLEGLIRIIYNIPKDTNKCG